jgi:hypothetical protein
MKLLPRAATQALDEEVIDQQFAARTEVNGGSQRQSRRKDREQGEQAHPKPTGRRSPTLPVTPSRLAKRGRSASLSP